MDRTGQVISHWGTTKWKTFWLQSFAARQGDRCSSQEGGMEKPGMWVRPSPTGWRYKSLMSQMLNPASTLIHHRGCSGQQTSVLCTMWLQLRANWEEAFYFSQISRLRYWYWKDSPPTPLCLLQGGSGSGLCKVPDWLEFIELIVKLNCEDSTDIIFDPTFTKTHSSF